MEVINALQASQPGRKLSKPRRYGALNQPTQFLPDADKDDQWVMDNADWLEWEGIRYIRYNAPKLLKKYRMANGQIDNEDYGITEDNEFAASMEVLQDKGPAPAELRFFPIAPIISDILQAELARRPSKLSYYCKDNYSFNELMDAKKGQLEQTLLTDMTAKRREAMYAAGFEGTEEEMAAELSPDKIKTMPQIEQFFKKDYRSVYEIWSAKQHNADVKRFYMKEMELTGFKDSYVADREFWHLRMLEDDYDIELWNPPQVFYRKSPGNKYISNGTAVGVMDWYMMPEVIDKFGWLMTAEQMESLNYFQPATNVNYTLTNQPNDGSYYDSSKSHDWNTTGPSIQMRQLQSVMQQYGGLDDWLANSTDHDGVIGPQQLIRVTTMYWKTVRRYFHLVKIDKEGNMVDTIVSDNYKVTEKPMYNTTFIDEKCAENLVYGEHLETIWAPEVWGCIKIGPNRPVTYNYNLDFQPIYLGINQNKPGRLKFQFKGDGSIWGCKLPVEGRIFTDRNTRSSGLIDRIAPQQVNFNMVNNQITDILIDEIGPVVAFDENAIPKHSLGEDWGTEDRMPKFMAAARMYQALPFNTARYNTEVPINFQNFGKVDLSQTDRLLSRIQLSAHFWNQAMQAIGMTPERLGQPLSRQDTATGAEQSLNASYTQTDMYFIRHCEELMPRVHQMRTELAQYYNSTNPSVRLQYVTSADERTAFQMDGTGLNLRDIQVDCVSDSLSRQFLQEMKQLAINDNTTDAGFDDKARIMGAQTTAELEAAAKVIEERRERDRAQQMEQEQKQHEQMLQAQREEEQAYRDWESAEKEKDRQASILEAQIRSAGGISRDTEGADYDNYRKEMDSIQSSEQYQQTMNFNREKEINQNNRFSQQMQVKQQELQTRQQIARDQLRIAKENKTRDELIADKKIKATKNKK